MALVEQRGDNSWSVVWAAWFRVADVTTFMCFTGERRRVYVCVCFRRKEGGGGLLIKKIVCVCVCVGGGGGGISLYLLFHFLKFFGERLLGSLWWGEGGRGGGGWSLWGHVHDCATLTAYMLVASSYRCLMYTFVCLVCVSVIVSSLHILWPLLISI